jgi:carbonic anhydrase/acetyltransferase-like protein (isoleucine patch superfamily)
MPVYAVDNKQPHLADTAWIAPNATVIGDVHLAHNVSIWWNSTLRGDNDPIIIGENSNIQDASVLHTDDGVPLRIGANVTVGHRVILHGCTVGDGCLIGMGAIVMNRAVIGRECLIGAGSVVPEGKEIPDRSLVIGTPGRVIRQLTDEDVAGIRASAESYLKHTQDYRATLKQLA